MGIEYVGVQGWAPSSVLLGGSASSGILVHIINMCACICLSCLHFFAIIEIRTLFLFVSHQQQHLNLVTRVKPLGYGLSIMPIYFISSLPPPPQIDQYLYATPFRLNKTLCLWFQILLYCVLCKVVYWIHE